MVGDFNGDGHDDIVSSASRWSGLFFYAGHGDGLFDPGVWFAGAYYVDCVAPTDLDGDGALDLVAACGGDELLFLRGLGDGTFAPAGVTPNAGTAATSIVVRDFDCDGTPDVALGGQCRVCAWHGVGDGTFASRECYLGGGLLATDDFDGDGDPDLAATGDMLNYVTVLLSTGSETAVEGVLYGAATGAESVTLGWSLGSLSGVRWLHVYRSCRRRARSRGSTRSRSSRRRWGRTRTGACGPGVRSGTSFVRRDGTGARRRRPAAWCRCGRLVSF